MVLLAFTVGCGGRADPDLSDAASASSDAGSSGGGPTDSAATTERSTSDAEAGSGAGEADASKRSTSEAEAGSGAGEADASNDSDNAAEDAGGFDADCFRDAQGLRGQCCATQADCEPGPPPSLYCCSSMAHVCVYCGPM
jgi:hypothetical protein